MSELDRTMRSMSPSWARSTRSVRIIVLFAIAIFASFGFALLASEVQEGEVDAIDRAVALAVHQLDSPLADELMKAASLVGSSMVVIPCVVAMAVVAIRRGHRRAAMILAIDTTVVLGANLALKLWFARPRPTLWDKISLPESYSFPSGHAMAAVGIWCVILAVGGELVPRARAGLIMLAALLALAIGMSRIYLGVHWPFDVIGGYVAGVPPLVVSIYLLGRWRPVHGALAAPPLPPARRGASS